MSASPLPHQLPALARHVEVLNKHHATLEASVPGFGKTFVACFLANYLGRQLAVLCPKSVIPHWTHAAELCGTRVFFVTNYEQAKLEKFKHGRWVRKNRVYEWLLPKDTLLVFDECHRCKDRTTQNAKLMTAARTQGIKTFAASATAAKDPLDLYALGGLLGLHEYVDFLGFCFRHGVVKGAFAFEFRGGKPALDRLNKMMFPEHGYRASYDDIPGFPENTIIPVPVEIEHPRKIDELYEEAERLEQLKAEATEPVVIRLRARQLSELGKIPHFVEMIKDALAEGQSVAVFVNFLETLDQLAEKFPRAAVVRGGQSAAQRQVEIEAFQNDKARVILCQAQAGGVGISLHDTRGEFPRVSLISPPDGAVQLIQILGRIRRAGAKSPAIQKIVFAENTVEKRVRAAVERKAANIETINDGDLSPSHE